MKDDIEGCCREVALALKRADVLLLCAGAGFSADSGLPTYEEIANVKAYQDLALKYNDICRPEWMAHDPEIFYGFWGSCFNDYRDTQPHEGYKIIRGWRDTFCSRRLSQQMSAALAQEMATIPSAQRQPEPYQVEGNAGGFFVYTSNVDAHCHDYFEPYEVRECHGNTEVWQCGASPPCCKRTWRAPLDFKFTVNKQTMRAPQKASSVTVKETPVNRPFGPRKNPLAKLPAETRPEVVTQVEHSFKRKDENWPICPWCKSLARPHVLMFNDAHMASDMEQELRFQRWREVLIDAGRSCRLSRGRLLRLVILEIGCGGRVPTVRATCETTAAQMKKNADVTVARINLDFPLPDRLHPLASDTRYLCLPMKGLEGLRKISEHYAELMKPKPVKRRLEAAAQEQGPRGPRDRSRSRDAQTPIVEAAVPSVTARAPQEPKQAPKPAAKRKAKAKSMPMPGAANAPPVEGSRNHARSRKTAARQKRPLSSGIKTLD